jgi:glutamyl-tRNA synthetase
MKLSALLKNRVEILSDINDKVKFLEEFGNYDIELFNHRKSKTDKDIAKSVIIGALDVFNRLDDWSIQSVDGALAGIQEKLNLNKAQVMWSVRIAVTGSAVTPGGALEMVDLLGKERTLKRLEHSLNLID